MKLVVLKHLLARRAAAVGIITALAATGLVAAPAPLASATSSDSPSKQKPGSAAGRSHAAPSSATAATRQFDPPADPAPVNPIPPPGEGGSRIDGPARLIPGDPAGFDPATSVEVAEKRRNDTRVFANSDGTFTADVHSRPIHYRDETGKWKQMDSTLLMTPTGRARNTAGPLDITVGPTANDPALAKIVTETGKVFGYGLTGAAAAPVSIDRYDAVYRDALPHTDVRLTVRDNGVKEDLILKSPDAPRRFVFPLQLDGLSAVLEAESASVVLREADGSVALRIPRGFMEDSNYDPRSDEAPKSDGVHYALINDGAGGIALELTLDDAWLDDPARVYPVTVDPSTADYITGQDDTYVATNQTFNGASSPELKVGASDAIAACAGNPSPGCGGAHFHQSYMHFNGADLLDGYHVLSAWLNIYETWSYSCSPRGMGIYRVTEGWGPMTNYPGAIFDPNVKAWAAFAMGYSAACPAGNAGFNVTEFVDGWSRNVYPNYGLTARVDPGSENDNFAWKKFASFDNNVSTDPYIRATYSPYDASYQCGTPCQWSSNVTTTSYGTLPITVTNKGKDTWPAGGAYRLAYHVLASDNTTMLTWDGARTFLPASVAPGQSITVPALVAPLAAGSYRLHFDMVHEGAAWFSNESVPKLDVPVTVYNPNPTITAVAPQASITSGTLTPTLAVMATNNNPGYGALAYEYKVCADSAMSLSCAISSGAGTTWTVPASKLEWGKTYYWTVRVTDGAGLRTVTYPITLTTVPTQPTTSLHLGADPYSSSLGGVSPATGNFATTVTDVAPATAGPFLSLTRTYNSQDPRVLPFGTGWSTTWDMRADSEADGSVVISYPDGHQVRFGQNPNGTYGGAPGNGSMLSGSVVTGLTLSEGGGIRYLFTSAGRLSQIVNADGLALTLAYNGPNGSLSTVTSASGRKLTLTWTGNHVTEVATDPVAANGGLAYKWQYSYTGDLLTQVCNAMSVGSRCTTYGQQVVTTPKTSTPYARAVLADSPKGYWRMDDTGTSMADSSGNAVNGTYVGTVTKSQTGGIPNDPNTAVTLSGAGNATVPSGFPNFTGGLTVEAWVYPTESTNYARIVDFGNGVENENVIFYRLGTSTALGLAVFKGSTPNFLDAPNALLLNTWQHIAVTVTPSGLGTIYRNGQPIVTGPVHLPNNVTRNSNLIGKSNWPSDALWKGKLDEVAVYDRALTADGIAAHYTAAQGPVRPTTASLLSTITMPKGNVSQTVHYANDQTVDYRKDGNLKQWSFASTIAADTAARTTTVTDPASNTTKWKTDRHGKLVERVDELGNSRRFTYDQSANAVSRLIDENGHVVSLTYDGRGNVLSRTTSQQSAYANAVVNSAPLGYWRLGEANGTSAKDSSGLGKHGAYTGGYTLAQTGALGELDTTASFDGSTGHVSLPSGFADFTSGLTIEGWVHPTSNGRYARIVDLGNGQSSDNIILHRVDTTTDLGLSIYRGGASQMVTAPNALQLNVWQHIAATVGSDGTTTIYRNGLPIATGSIQLPNNIMRTSNFIGKSNWGAADALWSGKLDEVAVYGGALSASTIAARYSAGTGSGGQTTSYEYYSPYATSVLGDAPTAYWRLGDRVGTQLYDATEHGYTATKASGVALGTSGAMPMDGDSAASFSGAAGTSATAAVPMPRTGVTLEAWVNLPDTSRTGAFVQVGTGSDGYGLGVGTAGYYEGMPGNHLIGLYENVRWIDSGVNIGTGWHHVAMTIAADGTATFFIDGAQVSSVPGGGPVTPSGTTVSIGGYNALGASPRWFSGGIDEVALYSTTLSGSDISDHYQKGASTVGTDPRLGRMTAVRDARSTWRFDNTYRTRYSYDAAGHLVSKTTPATTGHPNGRTTTWQYTAAGELGYNSEAQPAGLLKTTTTPRGAVTSLKYDSKGDLRQATDPVGLVTTSAYDSLGRRTSSVEVSDTFPLGLTSTWEYDELSRVKAATSPGTTNVVTNVVHTLKTTNIYDANGNVTDVTISDTTGGDSPRHSSFTYDNSDRLLASTNGATETTTRTYDDRGNVATVTDPRNTVTRLAYTPRGELATRTVENFIDDPVTPGTPRNIVLESLAYDPAGRVASSTDVLGRTTEMTYFDDDLLHKATLKGYDEANGTTRDIVLQEVEYDAAGNAVETIDNGRTTRWAFYDAAGRTVSTTLDPNTLNRIATLAYDADDNVTSTTLTDGTRTEKATFEYDLAGRTTSETVENDPNPDLVTIIGRDKRGLVTSFTDPRNNTTSFTLDESGRTTQLIEPSIAYESGNGAAPATGAPRTYFGFNTFGDETQVKSPISTTITKAYDGAGRVTDVTYPTYTPVTGTTITPLEHYTYDANGNVASVVDRRGQTTSLTYDKLNRVVQVTEPKLATQPASGKSRMAYDDAGNVVSATDVTGAVVQATYDDLNRMRTQTVVERVPAPTASYTSTFAYDDSGNLTSSTTPTGDVTVNDYNAADELTSARSPRGYTTTITRDVAGRVTTVKDALSRREKSTFDLAGRLTKVEHFDRNYVTMGATRFGYDGNGNRTSTISPAGWTTTQVYDAANRLTSITEPISATDSMTTSFGYDRAGNRTRVTNGRGISTYTKYQSWSLPSEVVEAAGTWKRTYDAGGLPATQTTPDSVVRTRTYDELGRLTQEASTGGGAAAATRTLGYNLRDLVSVNHPSGTQTFTYNDRGMITASNGPSGNVSFVYNADGERTRRVDAAGTSYFTYDRNGNVSTAVDPATGTTATFTYDSVDQLTSVTNGAGNASRAYGYDDLGRLLTDTLTSGTGLTMASVGYGYDLNSNVTSKTVGPAGFAGAGTNTYAYDRADRLTSWTNPANAVTAYGWDKAGNRTTAGATTFVYDNDNRLTSEVVGGATTATYTYTPRGTLVTKTAGGTTTNFSFDGFDRLTADGAQTYTYDGLDRLATAGAAAFTYAGAEKEPTGDGTATFARGPGGALLSMSKAGVGTKLFTDVRGDVVGAYTPAGTSMAYSRAYDPWGTATASVGTTNPSVGYQGSWTDSATGKVSMQARFYTPGMGTFASRDAFDVPITNSAAGNRYAYGGANPLKFVDPTGHNIEGYGTVQQLVTAGFNPFTSPAGYAEPALQALKTISFAAPGIGTVLAGGGAAAVGGGTAGGGAAAGGAGIGLGTAAVAVVAIAAVAWIGMAIWDGRPRHVDPCNVDIICTIEEVGGGDFEVYTYSDFIGGDSIGPNGLPSQADICAAMGPLCGPSGSPAPGPGGPSGRGDPPRVERSSSNPMDAVTVTFPNGTKARLYPPMPATARLTHRDAISAPPVDTHADAEPAGRPDVQVAPEQLHPHPASGAGPDGAGDNRCPIEPGGGMQGCWVDEPDEDLAPPVPQLDTSGASSRKGGGGKGGGSGRMLPPGRPGNLIPNGLNANETRFAQDIVNLRGGTFVGGEKAQAGIDGTIDGTPVSLKQIGIEGPAALRRLNHEFGRAERLASNAGYTGVDLYIDASRLTTSDITTWGTAPGAPLGRVGSGAIQNVYVRGGDGWVLFGG